jgi:hypothetical protein
MMKPRFPYTALLLPFLLASCESGPSLDAGPSVEDSYQQALLVMLDCRNRFTTAMSTLAQSAAHLSAQQRLEVMTRAWSDRMDCERRIEPILEVARVRLER